MVKQHFWAIRVIFVLWFFLTGVLFLLGPQVIPENRRFAYKEQMANALTPLWNRANFDGIHYLSIARNNYRPNEEGFFPLYPLIVHLLSFSTRQELLVALAISLTTFILALYFMRKLFQKDAGVHTSNLAVALILVFPTSFFFGTSYTGSLFLLLSVLAFYFAVDKKWLPASIATSLAMVTRPLGIILAIAIFVEWFVQNEKEKQSKLPFLVIPIGFLVYFFHQWITHHDPILFLNLRQRFGLNSGFKIILPYQVIYRYSRMLLSVKPNNPAYFTIFLEAATAFLFVIATILGYLKKVRLSYLVYIALGILTPSLTGTLVSVPRFAILLFPAFLILAQVLNGKTFLKFIYLAISLFMLVVANLLFAAGYWVA